MMIKQELISMAKDTYRRLNDYSEEITENKLYYKEKINIDNKQKVNKTNIFVKDIDCVEVTRNLPNCCLLNFASAHNPGGGWLTGSQAQEETITRRTTLYASINKSQFYEINSQDKSEYYSDAMIYSPHVIVIKNNTGIALTNPWNISVVSAPAVNMKKVRRASVKDVNTVMKNRIRNILKIAIANDKRNIVLGAWGCGVFGNKPENVAIDFKEVLDEGYKEYFNNIVFAIYHNPNMVKIFNSVLK